MNLFKEFRTLLPQDPRGVGKVVSIDSSAGSSTLQTLSGGHLVVVGVGVAVGRMAYHRAGRIEGEAPDLPIVEITI